MEGHFVNKIRDSISVCLWVAQPISSHFHQSTGRMGTQALTSSFRKDKTFLLSLLNHFVVLSTQYPCIKVKLFEKQSQLRQLNKPGEITFLFLTVPILICSQQKVSHHDCRAAEELLGSRKIVFRGQSKKSKPKKIVIYSVSTDRKICYSRQFSFLS